MMVFRRIFLVLRVVCLAFFLQAGVSVAHADQIASVEPVVRNGQLYIDADVDLAVDDELRDAAQKGMPLYFTADLEIVASRWWWFDKLLVDEQQTWRLSYNVLTRQWRVGAGDLTIPEATFDDALAYVRHIRGWAVANVANLDTDKEYRGRLRLRLDTSRLPRPFRIDSFNSSAWSVVTPWKDFLFSISPQTPDPS